MPLGKKVKGGWLLLFQFVPVLFDFLIQYVLLVFSKRHLTLCCFLFPHSYHHFYFNDKALWTTTCQQAKTDNWLNKYLNTKTITFSVSTVTEKHSQNGSLLIVIYCFGSLKNHVKVRTVMAKANLLSTVVIFDLKMENSSSEWFFRFC